MIPSLTRAESDKNEPQWMSKTITGLQSTQSFCVGLADD